MIDENNLPRTEIEKDYKDGYTYNKLAEKYKLTYNQITYLIKKNKWKRKSNLSLIQKGNKNAVGNRGGPGAERNNKRALKTGEYETILYNIMSENEQILYDNIEIKNKKNCLIEEYKMLSIREYRILRRIKNIQDKGKDMNIERIVKRQYNSNLSDETETVTEVTNIINPLQKLEDSLTRIQEAKRRCLDSIHKVEIDDRRFELDLIRLEMEASREDTSNDSENIKDDSFIKALTEATEGVWNDYSEEES